MWTDGSACHTFADFHCKDSLFCVSQCPVAKNFSFFVKKNAENIFF